MHLKRGLAPTTFRFPRGGHGEASIPATGDLNRPQSAIWWKKEQVLEEKKLAYEAGKIFLGRVDDQMIGLLDDRHVVTVAGSRGGKSGSLLIPNLKLYPGSALVIDPKGELARETAAHRRHALRHDVHVLDPWNVSKAPDDLLRTYDPMAELAENRTELIDNADLIADALIIANAKDPHWTDAARALLRALILCLVLDPAGTGGSLADLPSMIAKIASENTDGEEGKASLLRKLEALDPQQAEEDEREAIAIIRNQARVMLGANDKELASIISTARTQLVFLESPALADNLGLSLLRLGQLKTGPTTIYLCLPASRMGTHGRWLRLIVSLAVAALEDAQGETRRAKAAHPVLFILEEFAALGYMRALEQAVAYMAGYGVKLWTVLQDLTQLKRHYKEGWETFLGNAGVIQAFSVADQTTCDYLSKRLGETTFQITNKVDVGARQALEGDTGLRREFKTAPLLAPDELAREFARYSDGKGGMKGGLALVLLSGNFPFVVNLVFHEELVE